MSEQHWNQLLEEAKIARTGDYVDSGVKWADEKIATLQAKLTKIANMAHHGGLLGLDVGDIMYETRRLTLPYWDKAECERLQENNDE